VKHNVHYQRDYHATAGFSCVFPCRQLPTQTTSAVHPFTACCLQLLLLLRPARAKQPAHITTLAGLQQLSPSAAAAAAARAANRTADEPLPKTSKPKAPSKRHHQPLFCAAAALPELPAFLQELSCIECEQLQCLPALPNGLTSLQLQQCNAITALPSLPSNLRSLSLSSCAALVFQHCVAAPV
jgi:hypothetical protein